jgi:hypothetical protein
MTQAECFATAPQGNVTRTSHERVTDRHHPLPGVTSTSRFGEAELS